MASWEIILHLSFLVLSASCVYCSTNSPTVYQVLQEYDFPAGLLPEGAANYSLNSAAGELSIYLNGPCSFKTGNSYYLKYDPVIKAVISNGRLQKVSGVSVKFVVIWQGIVEVNRKGDNLEFSTKLTSANFPVQSFDESPRCA